MPSVPLSPEQARKDALEWEILRRVSPHLTTPPKSRAAPNANRFAKFIPHFHSAKIADSALDIPLQSMLSCHRFVMASLCDAAERGGLILPKTRFLTANRKGERWVVQIQSGAGKIVETLQTRILVDTTNGLALPKLMAQKLAQNESSDLPVSLAIIAENNNDAAILNATDAKARYFNLPLHSGNRLIGILHENLAENCQPNDMAALGVLLEKHQKVSGIELPSDKVLWHGQTVLSNQPDSGSPKTSFREFHIHIQTDNGRLPLLHISGGNISVARRMAEETIAEMSPFAKMIGKKWTRTTALPGGDFQMVIRDDLIAELQGDYPFLEPENIQRLFECYGTNCRRVLGAATSETDLGLLFGRSLYEAEVRWLIAREWATTASDILWRRTRLGETMASADVKKLEIWLGPVDIQDSQQR